MALGRIRQISLIKFHAGETRLRVVRRCRMIRNTLTLATTIKFLSSKRHSTCCTLGSLHIGYQLLIAQLFENLDASLTRDALTQGGKEYPTHSPMFPRETVNDDEISGDE